MSAKSRFQESHEEEDGGGGHKGSLWMISYIDLLSLLLAFFVLLFTLSTVDKNKFKAVTESITGAIDAKEVPNLFKQEDLAKIQSELDQHFTSHKLQDRVRMEMTAEGLRITMSARFFKIGEDEILPEGLEVLKEISKKIRYYSYALRVEGHTDNVPILTERYPNNWYLSSARSSSVIRYLIRAGVNPGRMSAVGYAEYRPVVPNDTQENRDRNRRVELIVLRFKEA